jgi:uncharacterized cupin superfamily protein
MSTPTRYTRSDSATDAPEPSPPTPNVPIAAPTHRPTAWSEGARFGGRELPLSRMAGASQVHVNLTVVPAGKQSCPLHYHLREEEHFFVLEGRCVLRSGEERFTVGPGDYVCFPAGTGVAHAFENPFEADCALLAVGPADPAEIAVYPESGKAKLRATGSIVPWPQPSLDYWAGEAVDAPVRS